MLYAKNTGLYRNISLFILTVLLLAAWCTPTTHALSAGGIGGRPGNPDPNVPFSDAWFIYNLAPGEFKEDVLEVMNGSDKAQVIRVYPVDSVATGDGDFSLAQEQDPRRGIGAWIEISTSTIPLQPGESSYVPFTISIPETAEVGEHSGGIIIQSAGALAEVASESGAAILTRVGVRVYQTVPGEIIRKVIFKSFSVTRDDTKKAQPKYRIDLTVENQSNVSLDAKAKLAITGWGKTEWFPRMSKEGGLFLSDLTDFFKGEEMERNWRLLKGATVSTNWDWPVPVMGKFTFQAFITHDGQTAGEQFVSQPITITIIPWRLVYTLIGILAALILLLAVKKLFFGAARWKKYTVRAGDELVAISVAAGVKMKKIMKVNKLRDPKLRAGQIIRMPRQFIAMRGGDAASGGAKAGGISAKKTSVPAVRKIPVRANSSNSRAVNGARRGRRIPAARPAGSAKP